MHAHRVRLHLFDLIDAIRGNIVHTLVVSLTDDHGVAGAHKRGRQDILAHGTRDVLVAYVFLVLIERDHLGQDLLGDLVDRSQCEWSDCHLHICQASDDRLNLTIIDSIERLNYHQIIFLLCVL